MPNAECRMSNQCSNAQSPNDESSRLGRFGRFRPVSVGWKQPVPGLSPSQYFSGYGLATNAKEN